MWHDNETTKDLIGFERFANTIKSLATNSSILPVTIGLFGDWGSGKSSVLRMLEDQLSTMESVVALRFDGWLFEGYDDAKAALMTSIIDQLASQIKCNQTIWDKVKARAGSLYRRINWFRAIGLAAKGILTLTSPAELSVLAGISASGAISLLNEKLQNPEEIEKTLKDFLKNGERNEINESIRGFRSEFEGLLQEANISTLVVLIDDLDRCLPESIVSTLEAIKLFLSVPGTAFVIAADERIVRHAISRRYPPESFQEFDIAQEYLDKLIQIPCILPPMDEVDTESYIYLLFAEKLLSQENIEKLCAMFHDNKKNPSLLQPLNYGIAQSCLGESAAPLEQDFILAARIASILARHLAGNPRLVKRFLNTFALRLYLAEAEGIKLSHGILAKLMVLERFHRDQFEELYRWQSEQNGIPQQLENLEEAVQERATTKATQDFSIWLSDPDLKDWLKLEPPLAGKNLSPYYHLARESLKVRISAGRRLSQEQQELFALLQSESSAVHKIAAKRLSEKSSDYVFPVYDALWTRIESDPKKIKPLEGLLEVAYLHDGIARKLIMDIEKRFQKDIDKKIIPKFAMIS